MEKKVAMIDDCVIFLINIWVIVLHRSKKELDDANKINALSKKYSAVGNLKSRWQNWSSTNGMAIYSVPH